MKEITRTSQKKKIKKKERVPLSLISACGWLGSLAGGLCDFRQFLKINCHRDRIAKKKGAKSHDDDS